MSFNTDQIAISTSAVLIIAANAIRENLQIKNTGTDTVFIGSNSSVTASNGFPVEAGEKLNINDYSGDYYGICNTGDSSTMMFVEEDV